MAGALTAGAAQAQSRNWEAREYGIGVVNYAAMQTYTAHDAILSRPAPRADTVAVLNRDSLCFTATRTCVRSYERMIEFGYEIPGWAILRFSPDSQWVQVTLAPANPPGPVGWVRLRPGTVGAVRWDTLLTRRSLFFLRREDVAFYTRPDLRARVEDARVPAGSGPGDGYKMRPLEARGRWLRIETLGGTCSDPAGPQIMRTDTLWIEYLTPRGRPRVFYSTRGC